MVPDNVSFEVTHVFDLKQKTGGTNQNMCNLQSWGLNKLKRRGLKTKSHITFPPWTVRTAKQKRVDVSAFPSILNCANEAAWPSMGCEHFLSTE